MTIEMVSNTMSAVLIGYGSGLFVSLLTVAQFHIFIELPIELTLPVSPLIGVAVAATFSMILGAKIGTSILYGKTISSILKGQ
jgi:hypothetical protein